MKRRNLSAVVGLAALTVTLSSCSLFNSPSGTSGTDTTEMLSGTSFLGLGYDVFNDYADPHQMKGEVLDFSKLSNAGLIEQIQLETSEFDTIEGNSVQEYQSKLSEKAGLSGSYAGFSGAVKVNFDSSHYTHSEYSFATVETLIEKYTARIKLGTTVATLKSYLTDNAKSVINDPGVSPEEVFVNFGTHVLRGIIVGGRLDYNVSANMSLVSSSQSIGVFAEAGYEGAFSVNVSSETVSSSEMSSFNSVMKKGLKVYGGASEYGQYIINGDEQGYQPWIDSIKDNPVFCDFDANSPMIPIWSFCDDSSRSTQLQDGYAAYAAKRAISASLTPHQCIVDIKLYDLGSAYAGPNPTADGYYLIPQDLNEGAGGDFIYVLFKYGWDTDTDPAPITGMRVVNASMGDVALPGDIKPAGFCDLNRGAGGDYIYLYFSRGGPNALRSIATKDTDHARYYYSVPSGIVQADGGRAYAWIDRELNRSAGGDNIFIGSTTDLVD